MINAFYDAYRILYKVYGEKSFIKQAITDTDIEEKNRAFTVKLCYGVLDKDGELSYCIKYIAKKTPKLPVRIILKTAMYAYKYLGKKPYAVSDSAVELVKKMGKGGMSGFVNAFLRKYFSSEIPLPDNLIERLSVKYSFPLFAVEELAAYYGAERTERILAAENARTTLCFYNSDGEKYLTELGADFVKTPFYNVFSLKNFVRNSDYDKGVYTFQALPSVAICEAVERCDRLLDCCAAPGGKSVRLSFKCREVVSWDIHPHRTELIKSYKTRMGRNNISAETCDAKVYKPELHCAFDAVLCDAPCSGLGVVNDNPDIKLGVTYESVSGLCAEQAAILGTVFDYVKVGGFLYYSTCSLLPRENSARIKEFLDTHPQFRMCEADSPLPHDLSDGALSFLPDISGGLGFYVAKMQRIKE